MAQNFEVMSGIMKLLQICPTEVILKDRLLNLIIINF